MKKYSPEEFLKELTRYNIEIDVDMENKITNVNGIAIPHHLLDVFAYRCDGTLDGAYPHIKSNISYNDVDIHNAIICNNMIVKDHLKKLHKTTIDHHDILDYLSKFGKKKVEKEACNRVIKILQDNFQEMYKIKRESWSE